MITILVWIVTSIAKKLGYSIHKEITLITPSQGQSCNDFGALRSMLFYILGMSSDSVGLELDKIEKRKIEGSTIFW